MDVYGFVSTLNPGRYRVLCNCLDLIKHRLHAALSETINGVCAEYQDVET